MEGTLEVAHGSTRMSIPAVRGRPDATCPVMDVSGLETNRVAYERPNRSILATGLSLQYISIFRCATPVTRSARKGGTLPCAHGRNERELRLDATYRQSRRDPTASPSPI